MKRNKEILLFLTVLLFLPFISNNTSVQAATIVQRKVIHNSYIYKSSTRRTSLNGKWKLYKGEIVTTYGKSRKFKNGHYYFRIGPDKQYVRSTNLAPSNKEATITVKNKSGSVLYSFNDKGQVVADKNVKKNSKFIADRLESGTRAMKIATYDGRIIPNALIYHIKNTNEWIYALDVKANKKLITHNYDYDNFSFIRFYQDTNVYNADGTLQQHNGQKIVKQLGNIKVDKLIYIWVPNEKKAELFYHLVGHEFYATYVPNGQDKIEVGHNAYVKAKDVKFFGGTKLTPSNTVEEAKAAATKTTTHK